MPFASTPEHRVRRFSTSVTTSLVMSSKQRKTRRGGVCVCVCVCVCARVCVSIPGIMCVLLHAGHFLFSLSWMMRWACGNLARVSDHFPL